MNSPLDRILVQTSEESIEVRFQIQDMQKIAACSLKALEVTRLAENFANGTKFEVLPMLLMQKCL
jgi:hypothetical protein